MWIFFFEIWVFDPKGRRNWGFELVISTSWFVVPGQRWYPLGWFLCAFIYDCFPLQLKRVMEADAEMTEDLIAYNIIPLDGRTLTNAIVNMPEVSFLPYV